MRNLEMPPTTFAPLSRPRKALLRANVEIRSVVGRLSARRAVAGSTRLHLGCGDHVLDGWANIDALGLSGVIPWDLTNPLPVAESTVDFIFSEHFIEHITLEQGRRLVADCHRVLRPGGVVRLSTPDLMKLVEEYLADRVDEWTDVNWTPATPCQLVNEAVRQWGHQFIYDFSELDLMLRAAGFREVRRVSWRQSDYAELRGLERRPDHGEVIVEATK